MTIDPRTDRPRVVHRLAAALQFVDAFTREPIRVPLVVSIPSPPWTARRMPQDATYRFLTTNAEVPAGLFGVEVVAPGGEYVAHEPITVRLPRPLVDHPPPARAEDYRIEAPLWPTLLVRPPAGETAIRGRITRPPGADAGGLRVVLYAAGQLVPSSPYARTDARGEFLFRLPLLKTSLAGGVVASTRSLDVQVRDASDSVLAVDPVGPHAVPLGRTSVLELAVT